MVDNLDYAKIIKAKISLIDYIGKDLKLVKSGTNYKALCPFHNEKTPSFLINQHKNTFNCFGCGKSGDIFTYLMEKYRIKDDVKKFSQKYNSQSLKLLSSFKGYQKELFVDLLSSSINRTH